MTFLYDNSIWAFLIVTIGLFGGAAFMTGRAQANGWKNMWYLVPYVLLLTAAARFIHFALYDGVLLSLYYYVVNVVFIGAFAWFGFRLTRARQMVRQYPFAYERNGLLGWKEKNTIENI